MQDAAALTDQEIQSFRTFGILVRRNVFSAEEMKKINGEFDRRFAAIREESDKEGFINWSNRNPETPYTASLLEDPRIYVPSEQLVGEDSVPVHSNANCYATSTGWHRDNEDNRLLIVKNVLYLHPTTSENGALRLIPGSHRKPMLMNSLKSHHPDFGAKKFQATFFIPLRVILLFLTSCAGTLPLAVAGTMIVVPVPLISTATPAPPRRRRRCTRQWRAPGSSQSRSGPSGRNAIPRGSTIPPATAGVLAGSTG